MQKRLLFFTLVVLSLCICGCSSNQPATTTTSLTTETMVQGAKAGEMVLNACEGMLAAEKARDEKAFMAFIPEDSPDYADLLSTSLERQKLNYRIDSFYCRLTYLQGDTATVNVTYNYAINGNPDTKYVLWTFKNRNNNWVYWHGMR